jgi:regulator of sigma E protease
MPIILFFVVLLVLVLVHEFGHFIVAKKSGIRVDEFAFGFPPKLFSITKGETTYVLNALPFGGYVKIYGENPEDVPSESDAARSFSHQPRLIQGAVIVAGVVFNLLLAWVILSATLMIGIAVPIDEGSDAQLSSPRILISHIRPDSPAEKSGLLSGDVLQSITDADNSITATKINDISSFIGERSGRALSLRVLRDGAVQTLSVTPALGIVPDRAAIGIEMDAVGTLKLPIHKALYEGAIKTYQYTVLTATGLFDFFGGIFRGKSDFSQVTGPVGIVSAVGEAARIGFVNLLLFTALISINLAVINVLPFPALDGGRLLFIVIEAIIRRPLPARATNIANMIGFALLILLMVAVTGHDIFLRLH